MIADDKLRERNFFSGQVSLIKQFFTDLAEKTVFRSRLENETKFLDVFRYMGKKLQEIADKGSNSTIDVANGNVMVDKVSNLSLSDIKLSTVVSDRAVNELVDYAKSLSNSLNDLKKNLIGSADLLQKIESKNFEVKNQIDFPKVQKVEGKIEVSNPTNLDEVVVAVEGLSNKFESVISKLKFPEYKSPAITFPAFPKKMEMVGIKDLIDKVSLLADKIDQLPKSFPDIEIPNTVNIGNFPPQHIPTPVTHISINSLNGAIKTTALTVSSSALPLPATNLSGRRGIQLYNNSSNTLYLGASNVTTSNGIPVLANSYSTIFDMGAGMILYGVATGSSDIRVLEISDENSGR